MGGYGRYRLIKEVHKEMFNAHFERAIVESLQWEEN
jgi:hypothetical protein